MDEVLNLITAIRELVRVENVHQRGARFGSTRDDCDFVLKTITNNWTAKRLDNLARTIRALKGEGQTQ